MKKYINRLFIIALSFSVVVSCKEPENALYDVFDGISHGAALRTLERVNTDFNLFDLTSTFEIVVEEQDEESGALLKSVVVYGSFKNNVTGGSIDDVVISTIPASSFTTSENGYPSTRILFTFAEALSAMGLDAGEYNGGDSFVFRLEVELTDGRTFSADDASGSLQGSYFSSPYAYASKILCIPATPFSGDYVIDMHDLYGDGWQGSEVVVTIDGTATSYSIPSYWDADPATRGSVGDAQWIFRTATVTVPPGTSTLTFEWANGDWPGECVYEIYGPNSGDIIGEDGPSPVEGGISLNLCNE